MASAYLQTLLAASAAKVKTVPVHGVDVHIRELSIEGRDAFLKAHTVGATEACCVLLVQCVVDETGAAALDEASARQMMAGSSDFVQELSRQILELSGLGSGNAEG